MNILRIAIAIVLSTTIASVQAAEPKGPELEKLLLTLPDDVTQGAWIKAWREKLMISYSEEAPSAKGVSNTEIVRFTLENKSPFTIKVSSKLSDAKRVDPLSGLSTDSKAPPAKKPNPKEKNPELASETWMVEPGKRLVVYKKATNPGKVMEIPIRNNLEAKALLSSFQVGPKCSLEIVPKDNDAKPLNLLLLTKVGFSGQKVVVSGFYLCEPGDLKNMMDKLSKLN